MKALTLPHQLGVEVATTARAAGEVPVETGGFILVGADRVVLATAGSAGIQRHRDLFVVSPVALAVLFEFAVDHQLDVAAQWHTHRFDAFLSETDLEHGFNVDGFVTSVVPNYVDASPDPAAWGWWQYRTGRWYPVAAPVVHPGAELTCIEFDEKGVR